jgi:hypothetical protein
VAHGTAKLLRDRTPQRVDWRVGDRHLKPTLIFEIFSGCVEAIRSG